MLKSQKLREVGVEIDPLRLAAGWDRDDLSKPQILVDSTYGPSHPGSFHLDRVVDKIANGVGNVGAKPAEFTVTDICDGVAQGHDGMNYSLVSREMIANMVEIHALGHPYDGVVLTSSCDKAIPAHLMAAARVDMPVIHVPGGTMSPGKDGLTLEKIGTYAAQLERGEITEEEFTKYQNEACPSCGSCQFMGTANTMQVIAEALGLALPGSALAPTKDEVLDDFAQRAGEQILDLVKEDINPSYILTKKAFENAITLHAAVAGSTNALLHIPAIAYEAGIEIEPDLFDEIHRRTPYLANVIPSGEYSCEALWYAGGVPAVMEEIKDLLHLDQMTVTGKTLGENLKKLKKDGFIGDCRAKFTDNYSVEIDDVLVSREEPISDEGAVAILKGNLAPEGAVVKHSAVAKEMHQHVGSARVFDCEEEARDAIINQNIEPGDVIFIRYEGPKGTGMPEMFYTTEAIASDPELVSTTALITDGRYSGATRGPAIGHVSPEAAAGGPIALVENRDLIKINIPERKLEIVGVAGEEKEAHEIEEILAARKEEWTKPDVGAKSGVLAQYAKLATSPMKGGYMK
ncbi:dihydroxyacid dehydratase/phosphogluconate dehydratase [Halobacteroides halobius DSM 5150]|uniref:Dihydroxyacid dehydratase/phosphogluconate dehydratase n=1 Tax=Halobacteroides halobius (strain ATCC 35273 / DSM 5150 / MD-1) TaxID=748449 RepID=L0KAT4_HALHC|nr:dihydroxy-acid dehydratase [Halobacteroides halobius]AGB42397.1 dihydroxyacid dehydratase/phosphogluconate dehydratase [Halobacteroides halobius DSM 5150]